MLFCVNFRMALSVGPICSLLGPISPWLERSQAMFHRSRAGESWSHPSRLPEVFPTTLPSSFHFLQTCRSAGVMKPDFLPAPRNPISIDFSAKPGLTTFYIDRYCEWRHFGPCVVSAKVWIVLQTCWDLELWWSFESFDPTWPFQVQRLCGQGW